MTITADQVRQLRERTGAGMMECKKALMETGGNFDMATAGGGINAIPAGLCSRRSVLGW